MEGRDRLITIRAGPQSPLYSVTTKEGKVVFENLSTKQLKAQAPEIYNEIKSGLAGDASVGRTFIDASCRP